MRMANLKSEVNKTKRDLERMKSNLQLLTEANGIKIDDDLQQDIFSIIEEKTVSNIQLIHSKDLFWEQCDSNEAKR